VCGLGKTAAHKGFTFSGGKASVTFALLPAAKEPHFSLNSSQDLLFRLPGSGMALARQIRVENFITANLFRKRGFRTEWMSKNSRDWFAAMSRSNVSFGCDSASKKYASRGANKGGRTIQ
jgi:hypothetical protein